jgi:GGDEF domain-containing protein
LLSIRSYDFVGRYGGEEFLLVLNNCNPQSAEARAEGASESREQPADSDGGRGTTS